MSAINIGGTWHASPKASVNVSGAWHSASVWVKVGTVWKNALASSYNFSITAGHTFTTGFFDEWGYQAGTVGSISGATLPNGKTVTGLYDYTTTSAISILTIGGFTSDPGASFFSSIVANGRTKTAASAGYSYNASGGVASWSWTTQFGFGAATYPVTINF